MGTTIAVERPDTPDAIQLITELEAHLAPQYPSESRHGYSVEKLLRTSVAFFVIRQDTLPAGCGGIQLFGREYGELKRMYVRPQFRGRGLAKLLLSQLEEHAQQHGVNVLRLETGIYQEAAVRLYESWGFRQIAPFGDYRPDPLSLFFEKQLVPSADSTKR